LALKTLRNLLLDTFLKNHSWPAKVNLGRE
jgi:hypothetical protein